MTALPHDRRWRPLGLLAIIVWILGGCAMWRALPELPAPAAADEPLEIVGSRGRVNAAARARIARKLAQLGDNNLLERQLVAMQSVSATPLIAGNDAQLLVDGPQAYAAMFGAIAAATRQVDVEMFIFEEAHHQDERLSDLLAKKAAQGVAIHVLYDALGSRDTPEALWTRLNEAGVHLCAFNPLMPTRGRRAALTQRDHRKVVVVDGRVAFVGGMNFSGAYSRGSRSLHARATEAIKQGWRDTQVQVSGPAVPQIESLFVQSWVKQRCPEPLPLTEQVDPTAAGAMLVRLNASSADSRRNETYIAALAAVTFATQSIDLTMAYFAPDKRLEEALCEAARRGVRVRLLLPGLSDFSGIVQAGRSHYSRLLKAGIEIFEVRGVMLHAKTLVVDGVWSSVGSANWDWLSFASNDELNVLLIDQDFAAAMAAMFLHDLERATQIDLSEWRRRSLRQRLVERFWRSLQRLM